jgi:methyltransferase-like protein
VARFLLPYVDGTRDRAALVRLLDREVAAGRLDLSTDGQTVRDPDRFPAVLQAVVEHHLRKMAEYALLVG